MNYLLTFTYRPEDNTPEGTPEYDAEMKLWGELVDEMKSTGVYVAGTGLNPDTATTVRKQGGETTVTDGPFAETKEVVFSFVVIDVPDLDAAIAWAERMPAANYGSVQITATVGYESA
jgi:hypothetical protein